MKKNENIEIQEEKPTNNEDLKSAIEETVAKISRQSLLRGGQAMCQVILNKITAFERVPGSKSNNDHKRLIKDIRMFCETALSRKVNIDGETELVEQKTTQN